MKISPIAAVATSLFLSGCLLEGDGGSSSGSTETKTNEIERIYALVIGMENSRFAGACPGARLDSERMFTLFRKYATNVALLQDANATKESVLGAMKKYVEASGEGLFMLYYSGHGGSDPFYDTGKEETDRKDEYLCLYDTYLRDNEIWDVISKSKGRVFLMFDACHSCTMYRHPHPITFSRCLPLASTWNIDGIINMQCWSGCPDGTYSYGANDGGKFTNTFLRYFKDSRTYDELWRKIESDNSLKQYEDVQRTIMGKDYKDKKVFR